MQKSGFLASEESVQLSVFFQKKLGSGFFGGEGFIMQKLSGRGVAFTEFDGHIVEYDLDPGESLVVDTGYLAAMDATCSMDIQTVPGLKNMVFGGEGIFNTVITGPGHVYLQTMPISQVAGVLRPFMPTGKLAGPKRIQKPGPPIGRSGFCFVGLVGLGITERP